MNKSGRFFNGRWALVTGASSGIGEAFARELARRGANLILTARSEERLSAVAENIIGISKSQVDVIPADLGEPDGALDLVRQVERRGVFVAHLVNNAGFGSVTPFRASDPGQQVRMMRVNTEAPVTLARHLINAMIDRGAGGIINVASTAGHQPVPYMATYGATKAFVLSFTAALAGELRDSPVRIMACCPGPVPTGFQAAAGAAENGVLKIATLDRTTVVNRTLTAYMNRRTIYTPGVLNTLQTAFSKILPNGLIVRATSATMKRLARA